MITLTLHAQLLAPSKETDNRNEIDTARGTGATSCTLPNIFELGSGKLLNSDNSDITDG